MRKILVVLFVLGVVGFIVAMVSQSWKEDYFGSVFGQSRSVKLIFVGDIMLSRQIGKIIDRHSPDFPFALIKNQTESADISFANLENPVSDRGQNVGSIYSFRAHPKTLVGLSGAGFDIVSIANNHIWDYGEDAFLDTLKNLKQAGIEYVGAGEDYKEATEPKIISKNGLRIAYLAYTPLTLPSLIYPDSRPAVAYPDQLKIKQTISDIRTNNLADIVVVSFHWGEEYQTIQNADQETLAKAVIDTGADLVIGHHPHVVQPVVRYKNGLIAYSLGNFIFDQNFSVDTGWGLMLEVEVDKDGIKDWQEIPVKFNDNFQPSL